LADRIEQDRPHDTINRTPEEDNDKETESTRAGRQSAIQKHMSEESDISPTRDGQQLDETGKPQTSPIDAENKFDALVRDRDSLRAEVVEMRKSLEEIQLKHQEEMEALQRQLDDSETRKEHAENQFQKLVERVNTIKSQLGERMKEDAVSLLLPLLPRILLSICLGRVGPGEISDRRA
jgi:chaperonin cofactor prefoldin